MFYETYKSPVGPITLTSEGAGLTSLHTGKFRIPAGWKRDPKMFRDVVRQLDDYFAGKLNKFDVPLDLKGTAFQLKVWNAMLDIPHGGTMSYGELARRIGYPKAARAVGQASGRNPVAIIVPCHRVVGSNGSLTGYGGGLPRKAALLDLEKPKPR